MQKGDDEVITGIRGDQFKERFGEGSLEIENNELIIDGPGVFTSTKLRYNLDGWTGRYGMPLEFLLATHIATMAPDLSYRLATSFDTDVQILLYESKEGAIDAKVQTGDGNEYTYDDLAKYNGFGGIDSEDALEIITGLGVKSQTDGIYKCLGPGKRAKTDKFENARDYDTFSNNLCDPNFIDSYLTANVTEQNLTILAKEVFSKTIATDGSNLDWIDVDFIKCPSLSTATKEEDNPKVKRINQNQKVFNGKYQDEDNVEISIVPTWRITYDTDSCEYVEAVEVGFSIQTTTESEKNTLYCSDVTADDDYDYACTNCTSYISDLYNALDITQVEELNTYVPYINCVTNHWFRNVYFTKQAIKDNNDTIVDTDDEYEKKTGERWTLYETYKDDNGQEQYELYVYLPNNGQYDDEFSESGTLVCRNVGAGNGDYILDDDGTTYVKKVKGDYKLMIKKSSDNVTDYSEKPKEFRVGKKAKEKEIEDGWMAYDPTPEDSSQEWTEVEIGTDTPQAIQNLSKVDATVFYKMQYKKVKQIEDGVRGETNPDTKRMFLDNYYLYDGTEDRALIIDNAKKMVKNKLKEKSEEEITVLAERLHNAKTLVDDPDLFKELYGKDKEITNGASTANLAKSKINLISGPISLTHSSLSAFSILRNMHTADAEFVYHDFKELIVELNYFDKEDLTETEDEVMMFPINGISSAGWPVARYDKIENYYGTLIHSAEDYEAKREEEAVELAKIIGPPQDEPSEPSVPENEINITEDGTLDWSSVSNLTNSQKCILQAAEDITYHGYKENWYYSQNSSELKNSFDDENKGVCCATLVWFVAKACGVDFDGSHGSNDVANNLLKVEGVEEINTSSHTELQPGDFTVNSNTHNKSGSGHIQIYAGKDATGREIWYNWGQDKDIKMDQPCTTGHNFERIIRISGLELNYKGLKSSSNLSENAVFAGFEGGEPVLAPVTGEVIKYGTVERQNIETGEKNKVGFIKIRVLGKEGIPGKGCTAFSNNESHKEATKKNISKDDIEENNATKWLEDNYNKEELQTLGYDYFWDEYNDAAIGDHVVYIEGFDVSEILGKDTIGKSKENITKLSEYIQKDETPNSYKTAYTVPNLLDDKREFQLKLAEAAKEKAVYTTELDNKIYIKEGAVIGYTYTNDNEEITTKRDFEVLSENKKEDEITTKNKKYKVGNYLRIIFRDTDDEIIENVENYMEIGKGKSGKLFTDFSEEFLYWMAVVNEGMKIDSSDTFEVENLNDDGMKTVGPGITMENSKQWFEKIGHSEYNPNTPLGTKIPKDIVIDAYLAWMDWYVEDINAYFDRNLSESEVYAMCDYHHATGAAFTAEGRNYHNGIVLKAVNAGTGEKEAFEKDADYVEPEYKDAILKRRMADYKVYSEEEYVYTYDSGQPKLMFSTDTPFSDALEGKNTVGR